MNKISLYKISLTANGMQQLITGFIVAHVYINVTSKQRENQV